MNSPDVIRILLNLAAILGFAVMAFGLFLLSLPWAFVVVGSLIVAASIIGAQRL